MESGSKGKLFKRIFTVISISFATFFIFQKLSEYTLAKEYPKGNQVLGAKNTTDVLEIIPTSQVITTVFQPKIVRINYKGQILGGLTYAKTVKEAVEGFGVEVTSITQLHPNEDNVLGDYTYIKVDEVIKKKHIEYIPIDFDIQKKEDPNTEWEVEKVIQPGVTGQKKLVYEDIYVNNVLTKSVLISEKITTQPVTEVISVGTKKVFKTTTIHESLLPNATFKYWRIIKNMRATAYDRYCPGCSGYTCTGKLLNKGMVAVDTSVIPLGTHLYIPGYGYAVAEDKGGAVKGNRIDLGFDKIENWYGKVNYGKYVNVYVLD